MSLLCSDLRVPSRLTWSEGIVFPVIKELILSGPSLSHPMQPPFLGSLHFTCWLHARLEPGLLPRKLCLGIHPAHPLAFSVDLAWMSCGNCSPPQGCALLSSLFPQCCKRQTTDFSVPVLPPLVLPPLKCEHHHDSSVCLLYLAAQVHTGLGHTKPSHPTGVPA